MSAWAEDYHELTGDQPTSEPVPESPVPFDAPLAIVYTSGVTGNPKGAVLTHEQTFFKNFQIAFYTEARPNDVFVAQMPLFHSGGLFIVATPSLCAGMTMVMRRGFNLAEFAQDIERYRGTIVLALTTMWRMILDTGKLDETDVSSVRCVLGGGERTPPSLFEELAKRGLHMRQGFGQTENSAMMMLPKEDIQRKMGSIGKPGFFTDIWIKGSNGKRAAPGEIGEIGGQGTDGDERVLEPAEGDGKGARRRRSAHRGSGVHGRRGVFLHRGSCQGHVSERGGECVSRRGGEDPGRSREDLQHSDHRGAGR